MLEKYFFIPASNTKFINNIDNINATHFVFDLEDSIETDDFSYSVGNLLKINVRENFWLRFPFDYSKNIELNKLVIAGYKKFVVPKIVDFQEFNEILSLIKKTNQFFNFLILVENPNLLINLPNFVEKFKDKITGIGLGSHDYAAKINMQHDFENLYFARNMILNVAKAYDLNAIDIASMEIKNIEKLEEEFTSAVRMGFDAKFFIHPKQLDVFNTTKFFTDEEIQEALEVLAILQNKIDYSAFKYNNKIYEKPHLKRLLRIKEWYLNYERI